MLVAWVLIAFLALLAVPVDLAFSVQRQDGRQERGGTLAWLFGLVRLRLGKPKVRPRAKPDHARVEGRRRERGGARRIIAMLRSEGFAWRLLRLVRDLLRRIDIRDLRMDVRVGLDDPADTGRLWAIVGPFAAMLTLPPVARVAIEPEFTAETLEIDGKGRIRVVPIQLLFVLLVFVLSPSTLRALRATRPGSR